MSYNAEGFFQKDGVIEGDPFSPTARAFLDYMLNSEEVVTIFPDYNYNALTDKGSNAGFGSDFTFLKLSTD